MSDQEKPKFTGVDAFLKATQELYVPSYQRALQQGNWQEALKIGAQELDARLDQRFAEAEERHGARGVALAAKHRLLDVLKAVPELGVKDVTLSRDENGEFVPLLIVLNPHAALPPVHALLVINEAFGQAGLAIQGTIRKTAGNIVLKLSPENVRAMANLDTAAFTEKLSAIASAPPELPIDPQGLPVLESVTRKPFVSLKDPRPGSSLLEPSDEPPSDPRGKGR